MIQEGNTYVADDGKFIIRKKDNFVMGEIIDLGSSDTIDNYKEEPYTKEEYEEFYKNLGVDILTH